MLSQRTDRGVTREFAKQIQSNCVFWKITPAKRTFLKNGGNPTPELQSNFTCIISPELETSCGSVSAPETRKTPKYTSSRISYSWRALLALRTATISLRTFPIYMLFGAKRRASARVFRVTNCERYDATVTIREITLCVRVNTWMILSVMQGTVPPPDYGIPPDLRDRV